jgi:glycosyltransferase involved in cell wall biosynthesis
MSSQPLKVLLDGTPLLGQRTGIGRYTAALAEELATHGDIDVKVIGFTLRGWRKLRSELPHGVWAFGFPVSARVLRACWSHSSFPQVELFAGLPQVVHGTNFVQPPTFRAKRVLTIHDLAFLDVPEELAPSDKNLPQLVATSAKIADRICVPTRAVAEVVQERLHVKESKIQVTPLGIDAAWFTARPPSAEQRENWGLPKEYLLFVGDERPRKGVANLIKALAHDESLPQLVIAGPGKSSVDGRIIRTGYLPDIQLRSVVAGASALILPSRDEGFGLPVLEAMACNVPVVCSDIPALREIAGGHASFAPVDDPVALAEVIAKTLNAPVTPDLITQWRSHAGEYTWRRTAQETIKAYRE